MSLHDPHMPWRRVKVLATPQTCDVMFPDVNISLDIWQSVWDGFLEVGEMTYPWQVWTGHTPASAKVPWMALAGWLEAGIWMSGDPLGSHPNLIPRIPWEGTFGQFPGVQKPHFGQFQGVKIIVFWCFGPSKTPKNPFFHENIPLEPSKTTFWRVPWSKIHIFVHTRVWEVAYLNNTILGGIWQARKNEPLGVPCKK